MEENSKSFPLAVPGTLVVVLALLGGYYLTRPSLESSRPSPDGGAGGRVLPEQKVDARLWQDPFSVLPDSAKRSEQLAAAGPPKPAEVITPAASHQIEHALVLPVLVSNSPYADDAETRLRTRYAVLSALGAAGYQPEDDQHLSVFEGKPLKTDDVLFKAAKPGKPLRIPFEWLEKSSLPARLGKRCYSAVLVMWLDEDAFDELPLTHLALLLEQLQLPKTWTIRVLGPGSSTVLHALLADPLAKDSIWTSLFRDLRSRQLALKLHGVEFHCSRATAAPELLGDLQNASSKNGQVVGPVKLFRRVPTDDVLADQLVQELVRRGIDPANESEGGQILLISEWDSFYGRALPETLIRKFESQRKLSKERLKDAVVSVTYLRGVDGVGAAPSSQPPARDSKQPAKTEAVERQDGPGQSDYLRRLAAQIADRDSELRNKGKRISAIGVLGSDVYDKLLILRALQPSLPSTTFFTTDLDNRLLDRREAGWTQNLVVSTGFGFALNNRWQQGTPPFRDTYQTALYGTCLVAVGAISADEWGGPVPRMYEIGRSAPVDISPLDDTGGRDQTKWIHPPRLVDQDETLWHWRNIYVCASLLLLVGLLVSVSRTIRRMVFGGAYQRPIQQADANLAVVVAGAKGKRARRRIEDRFGVEFEHAQRETLAIRRLALVILLVAAAFWVLAYVALKDPQGEPFLFFEGVSVWPTEMIRAAAACLAALYLIRGHFAIRWHNLTVWYEQGIGSKPDEIEGAGGLLSRFLQDVRERAQSLKSPMPYTAATFLEIGRWGGLLIRGGCKLGFGAAKGIFCITRSGCTVVFSSWPRPALQFVKSGVYFRQFPSYISFVFFGWGQGEHALAKRVDHQFHRSIGAWDQLDTPKNVAALWDQYLNWGSTRARWTRVAIKATIYFLFGLVLMKIFGFPTVPARGGLARFVDHFTLVVSVAMLVLLTFYVVDATKLCEVFSRKLAGESVPWPPTVKETEATIRNMDADDVGYWLDVQLLANRTAVIGRMIVGPFIVLSLMILARVRVFDRWDWPTSLILIFAVNSVYAVGTALMLRRTAEAVRQSTVARIQLQICKLSGEFPLPGDGARGTKEASSADGGQTGKTVDPKREPKQRIEQLKQTIEEIQNLRRGAFLPLAQHPLLAAILIPTGSIGTWQLLEMLATK